MTAWAALLRGVNVGKNNRLAMADLRRVLTDLGYGDVSTLLQSGNAIFTAAGNDGRKHERRIEKALADELSLPVRVLVRSAEELQTVVDKNPFAKAAAKDGKSVHVTFLSKDVDLSSVEPAGGVQIAAAERAYYLHTPDGLMAAQPTVTEIDRLLKGVVTTSRNWNTVEKLARITAEAAAGDG